MLKGNVKNVLRSLIYFVAIIAFVASIFFVQRGLNKTTFNEDDSFIYVSSSLLDNELPVIGSKQIIIRPYANDKINIVKDYYDYLAEKEKQENAIIFYDNTYMQNSGVDYSGIDKFDVISILDGTVINVNEDNLLGKIVEIRHSNEMISIYQSLSEVIVKKGDSIVQGQIIGKSGLSNIAKDLKDHLHFELFYKGQVVNPLEYFDKKVEEL
jgi:stage II sporulation protein Q